MRGQGRRLRGATTATRDFVAFDTPARSHRPREARSRAKSRDRARLPAWNWQGNRQHRRGDGLKNVDAMRLCADAIVSAGAKHTLLILCGHANGSRLAWPSTGRIAQIHGVTRRQVRIELRELEAAGMIVCVQAGGGRRRTAVYRVGAAPETALLPPHHDRGNEELAPSTSKRGTHVPHSHSGKGNAAGQIAEQWGMERGTHIPPKLRRS